MSKIVPLNKVTPENIEEQITLREQEAKKHYMGYLYGARNTWKDHKERLESLHKEINKLTDQLEVS